MRKKILPSLMISLFLLTSCTFFKADSGLISMDKPIVTMTMKERLIANDIILYVKVLDDLTSENSTIIKDEKDQVQDFFSLREVSVLKQFSGTPVNFNKIILSETVAIDSKHQYEAFQLGYETRLLKDQVYVVVIEKSDLTGDNIYQIKGAGQEKELTDYYDEIVEISQLKFILKHVYPIVTVEQLGALKYEGILNYVYSSKKIDDPLLSYTYNQKDNVTYLILNDLWYSIPGQIK